MALVEATMKSTIKDELDAAYGAPDDADEQDKFVTALAKAILTILKDQAVVNVTSVSGVTTGAGVSGPGTGTLS